MTLSKLTLALSLATSLALAGCGTTTTTQTQAQTASETAVQLRPGFEHRLDIYKTVTLKADLSSLSANQRKMVGLLIDASKIMDDLYWQQAFGEDKTQFLSRISDPKVRKFSEINYGPWDRLDGDKTFLTGYGEKPLGAEFYPHDMTKADFEKENFADAKGLYSIVEAGRFGRLSAIPYSVKYKKQLEATADLLTQAAQLADDPEFAAYLNLRAAAFVTDNYQPSDFAWMDMKNNPIDIVIGPIETYEDLLYGYRASFESYVLIKDLQWSKRLAKYVSYLPELQRELPVPQQYKNEVPGSDADLNAYDVVYYAGHSNAGSKTIAINLPNDEEVQLKKGTRRLQLKNAMRAKFDQILLPIADELIAADQRKHITFNAFFANTMFHEVAHGLGIKNTINNKGMVRQALKEYASSIEEGKADILGLYMVTQLLEKGVMTEGELQDYYTTFLAGIFRSVRFGASSAHGKANMVRFNYFAEKGAFTRDAAGLYRVEMSKMRTAMNSLSELLLTLQGNGDYDGISQLMATKGDIGSQLAADLKRLEKADIAVDIIFNQGKEVLGL